MEKPEKERPLGSNALLGALRRLDTRPANDLRTADGRACGGTQDWDDQWVNWDDLGGSGSWGDVGD